MSGWTYYIIHVHNFWDPTYLHSPFLHIHHALSCERICSTYSWSIPSCHRRINWWQSKSSVKKIEFVANLENLSWVAVVFITFLTSSRTSSLILFFHLRHVWHYCMARLRELDVCFWGTITVVGTARSHLSTQILMAGNVISSACPLGRVSDAYCVQTKGLRLQRVVWGTGSPSNGRRGFKTVRSFAYLRRKSNFGPVCPEKSGKSSSTSLDGGL